MGIDLAQDIDNKYLIDSSILQNPQNPANFELQVRIRYVGVVTRGRTDPQDPEFFST